MPKEDERLRDGVVRRRKASAAQHPTAAVDSLPQAPQPPEAPPVAAQSPLEPALQIIDSVLLANFTHQIINPLNGVIGTLDNIVDGTTPEARRPQRLKAIRAQLTVTIELVRNLAYLSELSTMSGRESLKEKAIDVVVPRTIIEAAQFFQESADRRQMTIHLTDRETQYTVRGHVALLRQVFMNLFENGIKYGDNGTNIDVSCRVQKKEKRLLIEVVGTGDGFEPEESERLFEIGFRGVTAKRLRASGSGLGLYICRQILQLQDATIHAEYAPKTRTVRFLMKFPTYGMDPERERSPNDV